MPVSVPKWLMAEVRQAKRGQDAENITHTAGLLSDLKLSTVCESARCPNRGECFSHNTATFLILGEICTRGCAFCAVKRGQLLGLPDEGEPERLAQAVVTLGLRHVVITSVTRDDLSDGGAGHYAEVVATLKKCCPDVKVELLIPDFGGSSEALGTVLATRPDVLAHNLETVPRLYPHVRKGAEYKRSLKLLEKAKKFSPGVFTKSGLMLGLGEEDEEIEEVLWDLRGAECDMLTLGQYLTPSLAHAPVARYVIPEEFADWQQKALSIGFKSVAAGPLVRNSYKARVFFEEMR
ncbi:MAG: lipoyl synthase [Dehalococcoidia bacterium]|nr:lipoyl synthase [Dehalococcoidia bacterium]